jgi:septal ring-binding cell division protein DamX
VQTKFSRQHMALLWAGATFAVTAILPLGAIISQFETFGGVPTVLAYALVTGLCTGAVYWWNAQPPAAKATEVVASPVTIAKLPAAKAQAAPAPERVAAPAAKPIAVKPAAKPAVAKPRADKPKVDKPAPAKLNPAKTLAPKAIAPKPPAPQPAMPRPTRLKPGEQPSVDMARVARVMRQPARSA